MAQFSGEQKYISKNVLNVKKKKGTGMHQRRQS